MKDQVERLLFSLVSRAVFGKPLSDAQRAACSQELQEPLYALAKKHDVAHLVGYALEEEGLLAVEDPWTAKWQKAQMVAVLRQERLDYELSQIKTVLEEANIRFLPLKGAVIRPLYPEAWMRTSCDIDVLVDEANLDACVALLCEKLAYRAEGKREYHDISLYSPSGVHLELHFSILEHIERLDGELARVWEFAFSVSEGAEEHRLSDAYLVFHTVAHMAYHFIRGGCGIRPFIDLCLMREKLMADEEALRKHLAACSLEQFYESAVALSDVWFAGGDHTDCTHAMQTYLLSGGVYGSMENNIAVRRSKKNITVAYWWKHFFVPYKKMAISYPILKKAPYLLPFFWVARGFSVVFGGKFKHIVSEMSSASNISDEKLAEMQSLLEHVGL